MAENGKDKKKFISEKIVGRPITLKHAGKSLLLALICGLVFGVSASLAIVLITGFSENRAHEEQSLTAGDKESELTGENYGETEELEGPEPGTVEETEPIEDIVRSEVENHEYSSSDFESIISNIGAITKTVEKSVVTVKSVSSDRGWFNDPVDTVDNYSGMIIRRSDGLIDILTTERAVINADSLRIIFSNGARAEA